ncbi:MAG: helix-turn-helix domain-containing protein [Chelatococcus sp.]|uniref:helix-turn-helix domain-containing protein n=1 Tax=Chelatococcus sp. TaxID=1953771 RepID=UPI0025BCA11F|nr:helix-turn-helix domain-containing protein [Chelatococcus sp.]MBX3536666.1 helix-turn-helix domain-containing protein [Chelatococcus sp.]
MGEPHPMALRERVAAFVDEGNSNREASRHFRVSPKFVNDLMKLRAQTGSLEPRRQGFASLSRGDADAVGRFDECTGHDGCRHGSTALDVSPSG